MCVCVCVCVRARERERKTEREKDRKKERERESENIRTIEINQKVALSKSFFSEPLESAHPIFLMRDLITKIIFLQTRISCNIHSSCKIEIHKHPQTYILQ